MTARRVRVGRRLALVVLSAALYAAAFPPLALHVCGWIALVPLLIALRGTTLGGAALLGTVWAVLAAEGVGTWFATGVASYYDQPLALGAAFFAGVSLLLAAPFFAAFAAIHVCGVRHPALRALDALWIPAAWVACELARARFLVGNPWALLGYSQVGWPAVVQIADLTGVYGISFVLASASAAVAACADADLSRRDKRGAALVATVVALLTVGYGWWALARGQPGGTPLRVAVVQGNADVGAQWRPELYGASLEAYLRLSHEALAREHLDLVVWPETAVTFFLEDEPQYRSAIARVFAGSDTYLVTGGPSHVGAADATIEARYFNSAYLLAPDATLLDRYDKVRLVPFGEYFPLTGFAALRRRFAQVRTFTAGTASHVLAHGPYPIGAVICFEAMYPELVGPEVAAGAQLLVNLTNDAWMASTSFARQHLAIASLRAVENRRYLVRAASTGVSAIIDPFGRVAAEIPASERGAASASIRLLSGMTLYTRIGDAFAFACGAATIAIVVASVLLRRSAPRSLPPPGYSPARHGIHGATGSATCDRR